MFASWTAVGVRAAFFVPSELPANWAFRANAPIKIALSILLAAMLGVSQSQISSGDITGTVTDSTGGSA